MVSLFFASLGFSSISDFDYEAAWKKVEKAVEDGLPKTAIKLIDEIFEKAIDDGESQQQIKATISKAKLTLDTEELGLEQVIADLEANVNRSNEPSKQILHSMIAELFHRYYNDQQYIISQRTNLANYDSGDIRTWAPNNFRDYIAGQYLESIKGDLTKYKTKDFVTLLIDQKRADISLRPTLKDLLMDRVLQYFSQKDYSRVVPSYAFKIDDEKYFGSVDEFVKLEITSQDIDSKLYQAVLLFQEHLEYLQSSRQLKVLAHYDVKRLDFIRANAEMLDQVKKYQVGLKNAIEYHSKGNEYAFILALAQLHINTQEYEQALQVLKPLESYKADDHIKSRYQSLINQINKKELQLGGDDVVIPNQNFLMTITSRNVDELYFKVVKLDAKIYKSIQGQKQDQRQMYLEGLSAIKSWNRKNVREGYKRRTHEEIIDKLPLGKYAMITSTNQNFDSKGAYFYSVFDVSDLAHSTYDDLSGKKMLVRSRDTGKPLKNVSVTILQQKYNQGERVYELNEIKTVKTNRDGWADVEVGGNRSVSYRLEKGDDVLALDRNDYQYNIRQRNNAYDRTEIFIDRAIYRPGQTVHFKTLSLSFDKERLPTVRKRDRFTIKLQDANGQEVSQLQLKSNDYGSAHGSFVLPVGGLTGYFTLLVDEGEGYQSFNVEEYKRPKFEVEINEQEQTIKIGDEVSISGLATALSGSPVSDGKVSYTIQRKSYFGWWSWYRRKPNSVEMIKQGQVETDEKGVFDFDFVAKAKADFDPSQNPTYSYEITVDVTDLAGETRSATKTLSVAAMPYVYGFELKEVMDIKDLGAISIVAKTTEGKQVESNAILRISELVQPDEWQRPRRWTSTISPVFERGDFEKRIDRIGFQPMSQLNDYEVGKVIHEGAIDIGTEGYKAELSRYVNGGKAYLVEIISKEKYEGRSIVSSQRVAVTDMKKSKFPTLDLLYIKAETDVAIVGDKYEVQLGTPDKDLTVFYRIIRDQKIVDSGMASVDNDHTICYEPSEKDRGGITLSLDYVKHNFYKRINHKIPLPWDHKKLNIELITKRDKVLPGSKEEWMLKISGTDKDKVVAEVLATMYDASLDQFVVHDYSFNPYSSHHSQLNSQFFGFQNARAYQLNNKWNQSERTSNNRPPIAPMLKGLDYGYMRGGQILIRGGAPMKQRAKYAVEATSAGVADEADAVMEEAEMSNFDALQGRAAGIVVEEGTSKSSPGDDQPISVRANLDESVFFYPDLKTDEEGNFVISFTMNEALTTWKLLTFAHDKDLRYGMSTHEVKTQKDLMIIPNAPRFLREADEIVFPATVSNLTDKEMVARVDLRLYDPASGKELNDLFGIPLAQQRMTIEPGVSRRVDWNIKVPADYKKLVKYVVTARSNGHVDGEENILPVITNQVLLTETQIHSVKAGEKKTNRFDALTNLSPTASAHSYTFEFTSNPTWYAIQALPYLMEYPHQCSEQIFNRMYANALAGHIANQNPRIKTIFDQWKMKDSDALVSNLEKNTELKSAILAETPWVRAAQSETEQRKRIALLFDLNKMSNEIETVLAELTRRQLPDGGFPWFAGSYSSVYITQNIVEGILHLEHLGVLSSNDQKYRPILDKALQFLDEQSIKRYTDLQERIKKYGGKMSDDHLDQLSIHYLYVRSFLGAAKGTSKEAYQYYLGQAQKYWLKKGLYSEAMIGLTLHRAKLAEANDINKSLTERSFYSEDLGRYWNIGNGFHWYELPIESHAMLIEFFTEVETDRNFVDDMKIWLLKNKQTNHWKTTKATSAAIYALLIQGEERGMISWLDEQAQPTITLGDQKIDIDAEGAEAGTGYFKKTWTKSEITSEMGETTIQNNSDHIAWGASYLQYFEQTDQVKSFEETPLKVSRKLFKSEMTDQGAQLVDVDQTTVSPGDKLVVRIEIKVDRNMSYVHLKDTRSSGLEPENVLSGYRYNGGLGYYESTRDLASHFFIDRLNKGTYVFEYSVRAVHKGDFTGGLSTIQCMYAPEFVSHSETVRLVVE